VIAVLLLGIPGNIDTIRAYMHKGVVANQARYKTLILSLPRSPVATEVPRDVHPEQHLARFITIGWLLDGVESGRIPKPGTVSDATVAMDAVRLSFHQNRARKRTTDVCSGLSKPMVFDFEPGQRIVLRAPNRSVRIVPATASYDQTFPFLLVTFFGNELVAVRPVQFRVINETAPIAQACSDPATMRAALAAGAAQPATNAPR
jgi:hypothetical protein